MVSQLTPLTSDGRPSENAEQDCVEASVGAAILWYQGKKQWDHETNPDMLLGSAYTEGYQGGTMAVKLVPICQKLGFKLYPFNGIPGQLIAEAHKQIDLKHPVIFTEPDPYADPSKGWSHVCVFYSDVPGFLTAMDPYPLPGTNTGHAVYRSDAEWTNRLLFNQIWILERMEEEMIAIDIHNPEIAKHFKEVKFPDGHVVWECTDEGPCKGKVIQYAMLSNYKQEGNKGLCGFDILGRPMTNEQYIGQDYSVQFYEYGVRKWQNGRVTPVPLYDNGVGTDPHLLAQIKQLQAQLATQPNQQAQARIDKAIAVLQGQ